MKWPFLVCSYHLLGPNSLVTGVNFFPFCAKMTISLPFGSRNLVNVFCKIHFIPIFYPWRFQDEMATFQCKKDQRIQFYVNMRLGPFKWVQSNMYPFIQQALHIVYICEIQFYINVHIIIQVKIQYRGQKFVIFKRIPVFTVLKNGDICAHSKFKHLMLIWTK